VLWASFVLMATDTWFRIKASLGLLKKRGDEVLPRLSSFLARQLGGDAGEPFYDMLSVLQPLCIACTPDMNQNYKRHLLRWIIQKNSKEQRMHWAASKCALLSGCSRLLLLAWHPVILADVVVDVLKNGKIEPRLTNRTLQCTCKGLQLNVYKAQWCMRKKGTVQGLLFVCRCMPHDIAAPCLA